MKNKLENVLGEKFSVIAIISFLAFSSWAMVQILFSITHTRTQHRNIFKQMDDTDEVRPEAMECRHYFRSSWKSQFYYIVTKATCTHLLDQNAFTIERTEEVKDWTSSNGLIYFVRSCILCSGGFHQNFLHSFGNLSKWIELPKKHTKHKYTYQLNCKRSLLHWISFTLYCSIAVIYTIAAYNVVDFET